MACGASAGWYYDDPQSPKVITLCPEACDALQKNDAAKLEIVLGCATEPA